MSNAYARARGAQLPLAPPPASLPLPERKPPPPLSPAAQAHVAETRRLVHKHMPEMIPIIKELAEEGLIDGWRNVTITEYPTDEATP